MKTNKKNKGVEIPFLAQVKLFSFFLTLSPERGSTRPRGGESQVRRKTFCAFFFVSVLLLAVLCLPVLALSPKEKILAEPAKNFTNYRLDTNTSVMQRVADAPPFVIQYLREMDSRTNYRPYALLKSERVMLSNYLALLPPLYTRVFKQRLIAVYFVDNFLGSGMADFVLDKSGRVTTILVLNPATMRFDISNWLTYKENTCFIRDPRAGAEVWCGTAYSGLLYILLHEGAHILDYVLGYTPYVEKGLKAALRQSGKPTEFTAKVWKKYSVPVKKFDFAFRAKSDFYGFGGGPFIPATNALAMYQALEKTPFASIYGSMIWPEDFAEALTFYHLTAKMGLPYEIKYLFEEKEFGPFRFDAERLGRKGYFDRFYK